VEEGMARGGPRAAMELTLRNVTGDEVYESLDPQLRERLPCWPFCAALRSAGRCGLRRVLGRQYLLDE